MMQERVAVSSKVSRGRWREALKDGLVGSLRSKALALND
jgi:hypothetical protein